MFVVNSEQQESGFLVYGMRGGGAEWKHVTGIME